MSPIPALREWMRRVAGTFNRARDDRDLEEELRSHLELAAEAGTRRGHGEAQARREARLRGGGVDQAMESLRDQRGVPLLSGLGQDLRLAFRAFLATPLVTAVAVLSLGTRHRRQHRHLFHRRPPRAQQPSDWRS